MRPWLYPLNVERLAKKQPVPILTPLVWHGRGSNPRPSVYETTLYPLGHAAGKYYIYVLGIHLIYTSVDKSPVALYMSS